MKSKRNTVWVVLTCMLAILVFVLSAALYRSWKITGVLRTQLAEAQNEVFAMEVVQGQQEVAAAGQVQTVRVMDGILQQQDAGGLWVDVAPVEELAQADPILTGRNKMQELIAQNKEAVQNGTISAEQISPLLAKQSLMVGAALASASQIQSTIKKTTVQTVKPIANKAVTTTPAATPAPTQQPTLITPAAARAAVQIVVPPVVVALEAVQTAVPETAEVLEAVQTAVPQIAETAKM